VGDYPAWSRDSRWLAYTGVDSLYVVDVVDGAQPQRVVQYVNPYHGKAPGYSAGDYTEVPPEASWSPDGSWLVYHRWQGTDPFTGVDPRSNAVFKLNLETGQEVKIVDEGMYPSWRWPAENPNP
jgi:Tol biopolymer transport system component